MGIYLKNTYEDRVVEFPNRFQEFDNGDGTVTKKRSEGLVTTEGTPITVNKLNNLENGILSAHNQIDGNNTTQNPDSIQKQVNAIASKSQLIRADIPGGHSNVIITFSENLMPGQYLRFVCQGENFHTTYIDGVRDNWTGNYMTANTTSSKFHQKNLGELNYATILSSSGNKDQLCSGEFKLLQDGTLILSVYQTMDSNINSGFGNYMTKRVLKSSNLHVNGINNIAFVNDSADSYVVSYWYSDTDGQIIGELTE